MKVRLHIDRVVLDGLDVAHGSRGLLGAAVEQELARLVLAGGLSPALAAGMAVPALRAPQIGANGTPAQLGTAIAGAVYGGLGGEPQR
jgi:hypothetical protein